MVWDEIIQLNNNKTNISLVGEIVIDTIIHKDLNMITNIIGGSPFNICKNLTKIGIANHLIGSVGNDENGKNVLMQIKALGIDATINVVEKATATVAVDQTISSPLPVFNRSADSQIPLSQDLIDNITCSKLLHFTYWPLSEEPSKSTIMVLLDKARENNVLIGFDPNYHSYLDDDSENGLKTIKTIIDRVDIIKPSLDDSIRMFGEREVEDYLKIYEDLGAKLIIMTLGKDGLVARYKGETLKLPSLATKVIDSTGAGDAFWSGLYTGIIRGKSIIDSINIGLMASAIKMKTIGAEFDVNEFREGLN